MAPAARRPTRPERGGPVAVSAQFAEFALDLLGGPRRVRTRRMFGAMGYYSGELFFAIAHEDMLWFKVDAASRVAYDDPEELRAWLRRALEAAASAAASKRRPGARRAR